MSVMIATSLGDIVIDLHTDRCPLTTKNFLKLCKIKYYNGCLFHTIQKDFTAQTGDPTGKGSGGDSIYKFLYGDQARFFNDEIHPDLKHSKTGTVAMASAGENLNASQFYFTLRDDLDYLDGKHTVFGEVAEGLDTLTRINEAYVDQKERPYKNIRIKHTYILDDPFDDPTALADFIPDASPEGKPKDEIDDDVRLEDDWVPLDEQLGPSELEEMLHAKAAYSSAVVLESIGDIPEAEIKPPENVLFVCKLNPVTEDEDLNTIFSRFGTVVSADIIRDYKTGDSLCYAFIEFETVEACEQAYFKMDNALIDDRRIHVDFSQSVAKLWSQYKRKDNQASKGKGCFKCGALDHIAKDCSGGPSSTNQAPKYVLKEDNIQTGGNGNSRYEMVFDEDTEMSPEKQHKHEPEERREKQKPERRSTEVMKEKDREKRESKDRYAHDGARRGYSREDTRDVEDRSRRDGSSHGRRHGENRDEYHLERRDEKYRGGRGREEYEHDIRGEKDRRGSSRDEYHRERREEKDYRRDAHGDTHRDREKEHSSRKRSERGSEYDDRRYRDEKRR